MLSLFFQLPFFRGDEPHLLP